MKNLNMTKDSKPRTKEFTIIVLIIFMIFMSIINVKADEPQLYIDETMAEITPRTDLLSVSNIEVKDEEEIKKIPSSTIYQDGLHLFTTETIQKGSNGKIVNKVKVTYENGIAINKEFVSSTVVKEKVDTIVATGKVQPGAYFTGRLTTYGGDCKGGNGTSSIGMSLSPVSGANYSYSPKMTYKGKKYYCLSADPSIPFGTVIKITNHNLGIESTAYGIVVDRGGSVKKNHIDIFNGTEAGKYFRNGSTKNARFEIVSVGTGRNFWR